MSTPNPILDAIKNEIAASGTSAILSQLYAIDYERKPVDIIEFIENEQYLGKFTAELAPRWKKELCEVFAPDSNILVLILTGAIGTGKTTVSAICTAYKMYQLSCLHDPARFYNLLRGSKIVFGIFNITLERSETEYELLKQWLDVSPYFVKSCPRKKRPDDPIHLPSKNIHVSIGSLATHALGENLFGFVMDEANFFKRDVNFTNRSRAHQLYIEARTRLRNRFQRYGRTPGFICLISSRRMQSDFLDDQIKLARTDPDIARITKIVNLAAWEIKPKHIFSGVNFKVAVGDKDKPSRILEDGEIVREQEIIEVPVEYKEDFINDTDSGLQNIAGISTTSSYSFFANYNSVLECCDKTIPNPFTNTSFESSFKDDRPLTSIFDKRIVTCIQRSASTCRLHPGTPRKAHIDIGLKNDRLGLSIGHTSAIDGYPGVIVDFMVQVIGAPGSEVDFDEIVKFFEFLRDIGYGIDTITFDRFESKMIIQQLMKRGFKTVKQMSLTLDHYLILRRLVYSKRIRFHPHPVLLQEMKELIRIDDRARPSHPEGKHDDLIDSVCGTAWHCSETFIKPLSEAEMKNAEVLTLSRFRHIFL